ISYQKNPYMSNLSRPPRNFAIGEEYDGARQKFGNNIILIGNVDKRALAKGRQEIDAEIAKVKSLLEHGGYFPNVDHHIRPDVPYRNMVYFLNELRKLSDYEETRRFISKSCYNRKWVSHIIGI
ncbi:uroporphyrinogen decarboxylase family protein, partial [Candidatus Poribacteria bacterium]